MKLNLRLVFFCTLFIFSNVEAGWLYRDGKFYDEKTAVRYNSQTHFSLGLKAMEEKSWKNAKYHFAVIEANYKGSPEYLQSLYYLGKVKYQLGRYEFANDSFDKYLELEKHSKYFDEVMSYKFAIAERFREGSLRHMFHHPRFPKILSARSEAMRLYDEIISTIPNHELAAKAQEGKAKLFIRKKDYEGAVESYKQVIQQFPRQKLASDAYVAIAKNYLELSKLETNNPDLLPLALINLRKFLTAFPLEPRQGDLKGYISEMEEIYARGIFETGQFYERVKQKDAAILYYRSLQQRFPKALVNSKAMERIEQLRGELRGSQS